MRIALQSVLVSFVLGLTISLGMSEMIEVTHESRVLEIQKSYSVYLPEDRTPGEQFPVVYVLHGKWGSHIDWPEKGNAGEVASRYRAILVFPDGDEDSWYLDAPEMPESQYESYVAVELVDHIDATYPTIRDRSARAIMGLSMGGHGALMLASRYPERFGSASSLSGILKLTNHPDMEDVAARLGPMEDYPERWKDYSVWDRAETFRDADVRLMFDCGEDDTATGAIFDSRQLHERLTELGVPHIWRELPGTHNWDYWTAHLPSHLNFHMAAMAETWPEDDRWPRHYFQRLSLFAEENARLPLGEDDRPLIALLGSSTTEAFPAELLPDWRVFNRGISSDTLGIKPQGLSRRLELSLFDMQPEMAVIMMGTNDLGDRARGDDGNPTEERMVAEFRGIVARIKERAPDTRLVIATCPPVGGRFAHLTDSVNSWNDRLREMALDENLALIDLHPLLVDGDGLFAGMYTRDGLHLTREAYELYAREIRALLDQ